MISDISIECFNRHTDYLALCAYAGVANDVGTGKRVTYGLRQLLVGLALLATSVMLSSYFPGGSS